MGISWRIGNKGRRGLLIILALLIIAIVAGVALYVAGQKPAISFNGGQWDSIRFNNALAGFIIGKGYGYPVVIRDSTEYTIETDLPAGSTDVDMEIWSQNKADWYDAQVAKGTIVDLGPIFGSGPQFYMIPRWMADEYHIQTIYDMKNYSALVQDPNDPSKGIFINTPNDWITNSINIVKLEAYGLTRYYNIVTPPSDKALEAAYISAQGNHQPVFGYYWSPAALIGSDYWYILKEPPYTDACWNELNAAVSNSSLRPLANACAYPDIPVTKGVSHQMLTKAPDVVEMLRKMDVELDPINGELTWARENNVTDWNVVAVHYLRNNEATWKTWVTPEAYAGIKKALDEAPP
jgi:glycine betaine/proline transport system substrate-binding protein